jgi:L-iditol 2-dehydrogenase
MKMLAAVYHGPNDLRVEQVHVPQIGSGEVLLKVRSSSICGTDLRIYHGQHRKYPQGTIRIPGHEVVGEVAAAGSDVTGIDVGQRVFVAPNMGCGHCRQCISGANNLCARYDALGVTIDGAFAEYVRIPAAAVAQGNIMSIQESVDPAVAALVEPLACVLRGQNAVGIQPGDTVLIIGAGPIGLMHIKLASLRGAGKVIVSELNQNRLEQAKLSGANCIVNTTSEDLHGAIDKETGGQGADVVIVAAPSHRGQEDALALASIGGRINYFGGLPKDRPTINFDSNIVHYKELIVTGTTACSTFDCRQAASIINSGRLDLSDLITARLPLNRANEAFQLAENRSSLKVVIEP